MSGHGSGGAEAYPIFRRGQDSVRAYFDRLFRERIVIYDGAMGTMIQKHKLSEEQYRGERFKDHHKLVKGNNDLLSLTQPEIIKGIHRQYLMAGADLIGTNTFSSTTIAQLDYDMQDLAYELNVESARIARAACDEVTAMDPTRPRFVGGSIGPTNRTASISPDVADASKRGGEAQHAAIEAVGAAALLPLQDGVALERRLFFKLSQGVQSKALRYIFFAERQARHVVDELGQSAKVQPVRRAGVVGGGTTGSGIAVALLDTGIHVTLVEASKEALERAVAVIRGIYGSRVRRRVMTMEEAIQCEARFHSSLDLEDLSTVDLVVEAVYEDMVLKQGIFSRLANICHADAILSTNTSSLDIDKIASVTRHPEKVVGMHFFSPTHIMRLVECVKGSKTDPGVIGTIADVSKKMKKVCVVVGNCEAFVGNRGLFPFKSEAEYLVEEGATPYQVDRVLHQFGFPMGPFAVGDLAGLDITWRIRKGKGLTDPKTRDPSVRYCELGDRLCELGRYGQKTGKGWYKYQGGRVPVPDGEISTFLSHYRAEKGLQSRYDITDQEILERCLFALVNESFKILEEGMASCPGDIDLIWINGYSFPAWRGGPMFWAEHEVGLPAVLAAVEGFHKQFPNVPHWKPSGLLRARAQTRAKL